MDSQKTLTLLLGNNLDKLNLIPSLDRQEVKDLAIKITSQPIDSACDYSGVSPQDLLIRLLCNHNLQLPLNVLVDLFKNLNIRDIHNSIRRVEAEGLFNKLLQQEDFFKEIWAMYFKPQGSFPYWFSPNSLMKKYQRQWLQEIIQSAPLTLNLNKLVEILKLIPETELTEVYLKKSLGKVPTKILVKRIHENYGRHMFDDEEYSEIKYRHQIESLIREELKTREHINNKEQSRLIRKMSIHAGRKLTLQEAQELEKSLKNE